MTANCSTVGFIFHRCWTSRLQILFLCKIQCKQRYERDYGFVIHVSQQWRQVTSDGRGSRVREQRGVRNMLIYCCNKERAEELIKHAVIPRTAYVCLRRYTYVSNSMEQHRSWEADSRSTGQAIPRFYTDWRLHKYTAGPDPKPNQIQSITLYNFLKIRFNIILQCVFRSQKWSIYSRFSHENCAYVSHRSHACYMSQPFYFTWCDHYIYVW